MSHIDTLRTFDELILSGIPADQARTHTKILNASFDGIVTKDYLEQRLKVLENDLKVFFGWVVGGTFITAILIPLALKIIGII